MSALGIALLTGLSFVAVVALFTSFRSGTSRGNTTPAPLARRVTRSRSGPGLVRRSEEMAATSGVPGHEEEAPRAPDEAERVLSHREQMFRDELKFNEWQAISLAEAGVDWHAAKALLDKGCSHDFALDILLP